MKLGTAQKLWNAPRKMSFSASKKIRDLRLYLSFWHKLKHFRFSSVVSDMIVSEKMVSLYVVGTYSEFKS